MHGFFQFCPKNSFSQFRTFLAPCFPISNVVPTYFRFPTHNRFATPTKFTNSPLFPSTRAHLCDPSGTKKSLVHVRSTPLLYRYMFASVNFCTLVPRTYAYYSTTCSPTCICTKFSILLYLPLHVCLPTAVHVWYRCSLLLHVNLSTMHTVAQPTFTGTRTTATVLNLVEPI